MEEKINIVEILKDKPANTKLYSPLFSEVFFSHVSGGYIAVEHHGGASLFLSSGRFYDYDGSEPLLFPSKEMRDWSKFAWKKGDVLVNKDGDVHIIFERFVDDTYCSFVGKYYLWKENNDTEQFYEKERLLTSDFQKAGKDDAQTYINTIEKRLGGNFNRETLNIDKQTEFKDGDIVAFVVRKCTHIAILQSRQEAYIGFHAVLCQNDELLLEKPFREDVGDIELRLATDSEKQQLFDALAKEGKAWDAEKKQIVDLKPRVELKPFDRVLVRDFSRDKWSISFFSFKKEGCYVCINHCSWNQCIPHIGNESLLGTTKDVEG